MNIDKVNKIEQIAIYCRVSTIEQAEEGYSIDEQERLLRDWWKFSISLSELSFISQR